MACLEAVRLGLHTTTMALVHCLICQAVHWLCRFSQHLGYTYKPLAITDPKDLTLVVKQAMRYVNIIRLCAGLAPVASYSP